jgi:asparagine synthase (glutamine-hydrolysing)
VLPPGLIRAAAALSQRAGRDPARILDRLVDESRAGGGGYAGQSSVISQTVAAGLLGRTDPTPTTTAPRCDRWPVLRPTGFGRAMQHDRDQYLPADLLTKVDRATMRVSLEARVPLLGAPVARLADAMPVGVKVRGGVGKWPLKELLVRRGFSTAFVHRPKTGFGFPLDDWLRRAIARNPGHEELLRRPPDPIDRTTAGRALDDLLAGGRNGETVWATLVLAGWLERNGAPT